jgi:hypothetical protein
MSRADAPARGEGRYPALIVDFGGVLTTSIWTAFAVFCETEGLAPDAVRALFRDDRRAVVLLRGLETGELATRSSSAASASCSASTSTSA